MARPGHLWQPWFSMLGQGASMATEITLDGPVDQLWQGTICSMTGLMSNTAVDFTCVVFPTQPDPHTVFSLYRL